ncbi:MAG TPA: RidA family protein [Bacteroidales bacterium]|nr:RidA family protein [Bacteroidales bacterium]
MNKKVFTTSKAPAAIGPYSQGVEAGDTLYVSGQVGLNPETGQLAEGGIAEQTRQALNNIGAILDSAGYNFSDVVKSTCLLKNMSDFKAMNEVYAQFYTTLPPARVTYAVADLPLGALVEIDAIAVK